MKTFWGGPCSKMNKMCYFMLLRKNLFFSIMIHRTELSSHSSAVWVRSAGFRKWSLHVSHFLQSTVNFTCFQIENTPIFFKHLMLQKFYTNVLSIINFVLKDHTILSQTGFWTFEKKLSFYHSSSNFLYWTEICTLFALISTGDMKRPKH